MAPISIPSPDVRTPRSSSIPLRSITVFGFLIRSFNQSKLSRPPASTKVSGPCCARSLCASATELGWYSSNVAITSRMTALLSFKPPSNMRHQRMLHRSARFERRQNRVGVHRSALENLVPQRIREGVQDGGAPTSNRRLADTARASRRFRVRNIQRRPLHIDGNIQNRRRLALIEPRGKHHAVVRIEHPFLTDRMADAQGRTAEHLAAKRTGVDHRPYIGGGEEIHDVVFAGFDIDFNLSEAGDVGKRGAVARIIVLGCRHQTLACQRRYGGLRQFVDIFGHLVAIVNASQFNRMLRGLRQSHPGSAALAENTFVRDLVLFRFAAEFPGRDFLELLLGVHGRRIRRPRHRVGCLAAAGDAGKRKILRRAAPRHVAFLPWHAEDLGANAMYVNHRLCSQVADARLEVDPAIRLDNKKTIEPDRASNVTAQRYADAAHFRADPLRGACNSLAPLELLRAAVERFFEKRTGGILPLPLHCWSERSFALGAVDAADRHLVNSELAPGFCDDRLDDDNALQPARRTLRTSGRCIR